MRTWFNRVKENRFLHAVIPFLLLGLLTVTFALATGGNFVSSRNLNVILGHTLVTALAELPVQSCDFWHALSAAMAPVEGVHDLYFTFHGTGAVDFFSFTLA